MKDEMVCLEPFDWRYSAAIVGLRKYLEWLGVDEEPNLIITEDTLEYNKKYLDKEDFLKFAEYYFKDDMHHIEIENKLKEKNPTEDQINIVNEKMKANTILKNKFKKIKFDGHNQDEIQNIIDQNREEIICETFRNKNNLYKNYCNPNQLFKDKQECCRLNGYYIDMPKKGKSISYAFDKSNYVGNDIPEFDFIPFAFSGCREKFFINDNVDLNRLQKTNNQWTRTVKSQMEEAKQRNERVNTKRIFIDCLIEAKDFLQSDIEIIVKKPERAYFETLYLRKESLEILKNMKSYYKAFCFSIKISDDYWINILNEVFDAVVNFTLLDNLINKLLKDSREGGNSYVISKLLKVNVEIKKGDEKMKNTMKAAFACAKQIVDKKDGNKPRVSDTKLKSYCTKLINAIILDDYDQFQKILINLSNYAEVPCGFAYDLFEDFEGNKEIAYTFVNSLNRYKNNNQEGKDNE
ncbi:type I CRISPR-associated protein Cas8a1/Csx8 [Anaerostipes hadrus]|uniref:Type I CRISPR-associated protein Cas8a1/Csx8 n=1 Tax=Anaerostipes amylophilus TaxID=2981779 RepID=A0ABV1ISY1_9FIRM|nr:type I CRISPR-associated protein Cas8a1/Csx8 [Anaerostipes hadrus]MBT9904008.1 type I CRISPR-associated protein Cas8a1/Csx8 [Anaerostipes hadrus]